MHWADVDKATGPGTLCLPVLRPAYAKTRLSSRTVDDLPPVLTETPAPWKSRRFPNSSTTNKKWKSLSLSSIAPAGPRLDDERPVQSTIA